jgi:hypothetical protein
MINKSKLYHVYQVFLLSLVLGGLSNCSQYKSSWSCPNPEGIGCSSITYADQMARKHIILAEPVVVKKNHINTKEKDKPRSNPGPKPKILIREHYKDFNYYGKSEIDVD